MGRLVGDGGFFTEIDSGKAAFGTLNIYANAAQEINMKPLAVEDSGAKWHSNSM